MLSLHRAVTELRSSASVYVTVSFACSCLPIPVSICPGPFFPAPSSSRPRSPLSAPPRASRDAPSLLFSSGARMIAVPVPGGQRLSAVVVFDVAPPPVLVPAPPHRPSFPRRSAFSLTALCFNSCALPPAVFRVCSPPPSRVCFFRPSVLSLFLTRFRRAGAREFLSRRPIRRRGPRTSRSHVYARLPFFFSFLFLGSACLGSGHKYRFLCCLVLSLTRASFNLRAVDRAWFGFHALLLSALLPASSFRSRALGPLATLTFP